MREFNREFGYKTRKHPFACCLSDIRRWIPSDNRKDCRPIQEPTGSSNDRTPGTESESYALHIEQLSSIGSPTDAQHPRQQPSQLMLDTSLGDSQKDVTCDRSATDISNDQHQERRPSFAADDQRELPDKLQAGIVSHTYYPENKSPNDTCPPLFGRDNRFYYARQPETDNSESRYINDHHDIGTQSHVIVHPIRFPTFQSEYSDAYEERCASRHRGVPVDRNHTPVDRCMFHQRRLANIQPEEENVIRAAESIHLPPGIKRPRQIAEAEPDLERCIGLHESADLFPDGNGDWNLQNASSLNTSTRSIPPDSTPSLLLFPSSEETRSPDAIRSNRETASPPCMANGDLNRGSAAIWTGDNSVEETSEGARTGSDVITINKQEVFTKRNIIKEKFPSVINTLSTLNVHGKYVNKPRVATSILSSLTMEVKCSKNEDNNAHFRIREVSQDIQLQNCQQTKTLPRKRQKKRSTYQPHKSIIQRIPEIADRCEKSVMKCEKTLVS